jgi:hypothetical protein
VAGLDMKRPQSVSLGAHTHRINWPSKLISKKRLMGRALRMHDIIEVSTHPGFTQQQQTLIHEILHMAFYNTPVHHFAGWSDDVEEAIISALEGPLLELMQRPENKPVRRWLSVVH